MTKAIIIIFSALTIIACDNVDKGEKVAVDSISNNNHVVIDSSDILIDKTEKNSEPRVFGQNFDLIDNSFSFKNKVFDLGASYDLVDCGLFFECDCCSGNLILTNDSVFYYVDYCMEDLMITRGFFSTHSDNITFVSDGIQVKKEYDPSKESVPGKDEFLLTDTLTDSYTMTFKIKSCDQKPLLVDNQGKNIWIAALTDIKAEEKIKMLERDGILKRFKQSSIKGFEK